MKNTISSIRILCVLLALCFFGHTRANAQTLNVIPAPAEVAKGAGEFTITEKTSVSYKDNKEVAQVAAYLRSRLQTLTGFNPGKSQSPAQSRIELELYEKFNDHYGDEGYSLKVSPEVILLSANKPAGLFYASQTLLQLIPTATTDRKSDKLSIPAVTITDVPRFGWRGIMLDVSRHFFSKEYVKEFVDQMARYKFNRLHLHLTDDNGWRVEIKSLPKLTEVGAWRVARTGTFGSHDAPKPGEKPSYGGFYTQADIKEIVQYAKDRYIEIIPEIDVPGHSMAALAAYPELSVTKDTSVRVNPGSKFSTWFGNGKFEMHIDNTLNPTDEKVYTFLDKVFTELASLFPYEYIHMGGDECYKGYWEKDPKVQAFMKKNNMKDGHDLQSYFSKRVNDIIVSKKKKAIGWDEILEGGAPAGAAVMSWQGVKGGIEASKQKLKVVMSPAPLYYLDMMQGDPSIEARVYNSARLKDVYQFDILPAGIDSAYVLGGQGNLWTEQIRIAPQVEYMTYPRAFAIAETLWSPKSKKNYSDFVKRVENHFERFDSEEINYSRSLYDPIIAVRKNSEGKLVVDLTAEAPDLDFYYTFDNTIPNQYYDKYQAPLVIPEGTDMLRISSYRGKKQMGRIVSLTMEDLTKRIKR